MQLELASLQNVAGFDEISSGQTSRIRADLRDWGQEWKNLGQKLRIWGRSEQLGVAHQGWGGTDLCTLKMQDRILSAPNISSRSLPRFADWRVT